MAIFDDIPLGWAGKSYTIPHDRVMGAISRIEDHVTLDELIRFQARGTAPMAKIATAYATLIRYCGGSVTADEVYAGMFKADAGDDVSKAVAGLLHMMVPPERLVEGQPVPGNGQPAAAGLSSKPIKRRSGRNGSRASNFGQAARGSSGG